jgi:GNAT superfamily N-acetyltransferase
VIEVRPLMAGEEWAVLDLARAMHGESPAYAPYPFEAKELSKWIALCRDADDWLCIIAWEDDRPIGFMAVGAVAMLFSASQTVDDLALYVVPDRRGTTAALRLLRMMEPWAKAMGAKAIRMGVTTGINQAQTVKFLERLGYVQTGVLLTKQL